MIESSGHIHQLGYDEEGEIDSILDEAEKKNFQHRQNVHQTEIREYEDISYGRLGKV